MSLVAYATSSDEDSDCETSAEACAPVSLNQTNKNSIAIEKPQNGQQQQQNQEPSKSLNLPQPKNIQIESSETIDGDDFSLNLPAPKQSQALDVEEADDEFLHKKVDPSLIEKPTPLRKTQKQRAGTRQPVKITIPSLAELRTNDDDAATSSSGKSFSVGPNPKKSSGLLSMLPPPKFNGTFGKPREKPDSTSTASVASPAAVTTKTTSLIPHSVSKRQAAAKATNVKPSNAEKKSNLGLNYSNNSDDSDADDDASGDFFSLNTETKLPEVSAAEINAMVAKKTNRMAEVSRSLDMEQRAAAEANEHAQNASASHAAVADHDQINIEALIGARAAKRSRKDDIQFIDIRQDQVASTNEEWMRNRLQAETEFQPTGRLVGSDQPGAGSKKKHQITYLAYQAKANEAELQAMWANNRQSRRQTQSKYGF